MTGGDALAVCEKISQEVVDPQAHSVDATGSFPRDSLDALGSAGLLGLLSSTDVGGMGLGLADAAAVVRRLAASCGSTAMVVCMHYCAAAVIEEHGPREVREAIAAGRHLTTLAFSETGSRSHFWASLGTAERSGDTVVLNASKSWVTSAAEANSYVWLSRSMAATDAASLWLVPATTPGVMVVGEFDGLGLRGNGSRPVDARGAAVPASAALGPDGAGLDIALATALPTFLILNASCSLGLMDAGTAKALAHVTTARLEHLGQTLAEQPVTRQHVAAMRNHADAAAALVTDAVAALSSARADAPLRMLQAKAVADDAAVAVLDRAMRVGGGAAFRKDVGIERNFRDARASTVMAPTLDSLNDFIGRALTGLPLFG